MRKNVFLFAMLVSFVAVYSHAAVAETGTLTQWLEGLGSQYKCPQLDMNNPLYAGGACVEGCDEKPEKISAMFAVEVKEGGAKFCVRGIKAWRQKRSHDPKFTFWESKNDVNECVWLCYPGYSGTTCQNKVGSTAKTCDPTELTPITAAKADFETGVEAFYRIKHDNKKCEKKDKHFGEKTANNNASNHDVFLAITKYDEGKHGAWVQDILAYSWCKNNSASTCRTVISKNTKDPILMCKDGYQQSTDGKTCVPIDSHVCGTMTKCDGWPLPDRDDLKRVVVEVDGKSCYQHRCKGSNKGFANEELGENTQCKDCLAGEGQDAHVVEDGRCVFTSKGVDPDFDPVGKPACNGWDDTKYKNAAYEPYVIDNNGVMCLQYRCAKGYAYTKEDPTTCDSCTGDNQMPDQDGFCITVEGNPGDCDEWKNITDKQPYTKIYDETNKCYTYLCKEKGYALSDDKNCTPCKGTVQPDGTCKKEFEESNKSDITTAKAKDGTLCWMKCQDSQCFKSCLKGEL